MAHSDFVINGTVLENYTGQDKSLVLPTGITEIASKAFAGNSGIISVTVPKGDQSNRTRNALCVQSSAESLLPKR